MALTDCCPHMAEPCATVPARAADNVTDLVQVFDPFSAILNSSSLFIPSNPPVPQNIIDTVRRLPQRTPLTWYHGMRMRMHMQVSDISFLPPYTEGLTNFIRLLCLLYSQQLCSSSNLVSLAQFKQLFALFDSNVAKAATIPGYDAGIIQARRHPFAACMLAGYG